jgi:hypothetical protein
LFFSWIPSVSNAYANMMECGFESHCPHQVIKCTNFELGDINMAIVLTPVESERFTKQINVPAKPNEKLKQAMAKFRLNQNA